MTKQPLPILNRVRQLKRYCIELQLNRHDVVDAACRHYVEHGDAVPLNQVWSLLREFGTQKERTSEAKYILARVPSLTYSVELHWEHNPNVPRVYLEVGK